MKDIQTRSDIEYLVDKFYQQAKNDELIGHFFAHAMVPQWESHVLLICDFWETILLGNIVYHGNPMLKHLELHQRILLEPRHFEHWLALWQDAVEEHFSGVIAIEAVRRAQQIGELMKYKVKQL